MKLCKKLLVSIIVLTMIIGMLPMMVMAEDATPKDLVVKIVDPTVTSNTGTAVNFTAAAGKVYYATTVDGALGNLDGTAFSETEPAGGWQIKLDNTADPAILTLDGADLNTSWRSTASAWENAKTSFRGVVDIEGAGSLEIRIESDSIIHLGGQGGFTTKMTGGTTITSELLPNGERALFELVKRTGTSNTQQSAIRELVGDLTIQNANIKTETSHNQAEDTIAVRENIYVKGDLLIDNSSVEMKSAYGQSLGMKALGDVTIQNHSDVSFTGLGTGYAVHAGGEFKIDNASLRIRSTNTKSAAYYINKMPTLVGNVIAKYNDVKTSSWDNITEWTKLDVAAGTDMTSGYVYWNISFTPCDHANAIRTDCTVAGTCPDCQAQLPGQANHTPAYSPVDMSKHTVTCSNGGCSYTTEGAHDFAGAAECILCGYSIGAEELTVEIIDMTVSAVADKKVITVEAGKVLYANTATKQAKDWIYGTNVGTHETGIVSDFSETDPGDDNWNIKIDNSLNPAVITLDGAVFGHSVLAGSGLSVLKVAGNGALEIVIKSDSTIEYMRGNGITTAMTAGVTYTSLNNAQLFVNGIASTKVNGGTGAIVATGGDLTFKDANIRLANQNASGPHYVIKAVNLNVENTTLKIDGRNKKMGSMNISGDLALKNSYVFVKNYGYTTGVNVAGDFTMDNASTLGIFTSEDVSKDSTDNVLSKMPILPEYMIAKYSDSIDVYSISGTTSPDNAIAKMNEALADATVWTALTTQAGEAVDHNLIYITPCAHEGAAEQTDCTVAVNCPDCGTAVYNANASHRPVISYNGYTHLTTCANTGCQYSLEEAHAPGAAATCTTDQICTVCNYVLVERHHIPADGEYSCHVAHPCARCSENYREAGVHIPGAPADCYNPQTCTGCGAEIAPSRGHIPGAAADCENDQICVECGEVLNPRLDHIASEKVIENEISATYTETGSYEEVVYCTACGEELSRVTVTTPMLVSPYLSFTLNEDGASYSVTDCVTSASGELVIPATYNGKPVTTIGEDAFYGCESLTSITIPDSVTTIGDWAFYYCTGLTSITIPDSVTSIGYWAFEDCTSLTSITIPDSVTTIGNVAFYNCTNLTTITIGSGVTNIGGGVFERCTSLTGIWVDENNLNYSSDSYGVLFSKDKTELICAPKAISGSYAIPDGVTTIGNSAFSRCTGLTSVTIPDSVTYIESFAFDNCSGLTNITIPDSVTTIDFGAFWWCTGLTSVNIPDSVTTIGDEAFLGCENLTSVTIGNNITTIGASAFEWCWNLKSITIPESVTSIGSHAFYYCTSLTGIWVDENNPNYSSDSYGVLFNKDKTVLISTPGAISGSYVVPDSVTTIGDSAFSYCTGLTSITIPDSVTTLGEYTFSGCTGLTSITIPDSVTVIDDWAFYNCTGLTSITIPDSITTIGSYAFYDCTILETVYYTGTEEQWNAIEIAEDNDYLTNATIVFEYKEPVVGIPGDMDGNEVVDQEDAVYLLLHTLFGDTFYPLGDVDADIDGNGVVDQEDAVYLLLHTLFGDAFYPLKKGA